ncbi:MAG: D-glycero-beta-D-manno-heptose-7-phosphate kinase [Candidatus Omnitrophica bacterium]|jgi:D-beta-D-heptose 7-phosphate kinase/D-beta-D-heptose 1-phosphate adenosyltransferase|nr:D-glycero-beta-D-manno-heptose-7-phosphate kinase [Candidatus Omnitrophota bacterium]
MNGDKVIDLKFSALEKIVKKFENKRLLVVGDLLLDQFVWGDVSRISPEAPVPVVWVRNEGFMPGGACNVANNLAKFGAVVDLAGVVGQDEKAGVLKDLLRERNISFGGVITDSQRPTILKTRVIAHHQQVVRIDRENTEPIAGPVLEKMRAYIKTAVREVDGVIIEDYGKGVITPGLLKIVMPLAKKYRKIVSVDPKESHFSYYRGATVITPNNHEASRMAGFTIKDDATLKRAGEKLLKDLDLRVALITLGENGMAVFEKGEKPCKIPTVAREVFDVSGAGDTVISVYTLALVSGASPIEAAHIANCAAGIVVGKVGVAVVSKEEILAGLKERVVGKGKEKGKG